MLSTSFQQLRNPDSLKQTGHSPSARGMFLHQSRARIHPGSFSIGTAKSMHRFGRAPGSRNTLHRELDLVLLKLDRRIHVIVQCRIISPELWLKTPVSGEYQSTSELYELSLAMKPCVEVRGLTIFIIGFGQENEEKGVLQSPWISQFYALHIYLV